MILRKDEVTRTLVETAKMIYAEQADDEDVPTSVRDLDSFNLVQIVLELENNYDVRLFEGLQPYRAGEGYRSGDFEEFAEVIVAIAAEQGPAEDEEAHA
ncbi:hypothetical protein [Amycolatopsis magusensis]|uniref:Carrier domain-containing protein n=1 Tax=Amycolatopsis magusensis TaxID=882444 RepID=A0ABS4PZG9_9PSEU|nr:hypothetical protein [Amycolatopsis magusensis]MBP2184254.1 hypothetical protein [Amycolatopsis magusensis]MDI5980603.1 hypothetical protein [Amycolatopsis magusensis]